MSGHERDMRNAEGGEEERPWEKPGQVRRDCEPHRSSLLFLMARTSLVCGLLSLCLCFPALVGLPLAVLAYTLANRDLGRMEDGTMDPAGASQARRARDTAFAGALLSGPVLALGCLYAAFQALVTIYEALRPVRE